MQTDLGKVKGRGGAFGVVSPGCVGFRFVFSFSQNFAVLLFFFGFAGVWFAVLLPLFFGWGGLSEGSCFKGGSSGEVFFQGGGSSGVVFLVRGGITLGVFCCFFISIVGRHRGGGVQTRGVGV